ncbi:MAG: response regulator [Ardenticatenaceae bacterium]|nr:response regulator [Ardenticatenaceae bacterium]
MSEHFGRILVVDDVRLMRTTFAASLQEAGYDVDMAENGLQAMEMMRKHPFDLILLDLIMPEMDGYQVLAAMKSHQKLRNIPVVAASAMGDMDSVVRCLEMGAVDHLDKPFDPEVLLAKVKYVLEHHRQQVELQKLVRELNTKNEVLAQEIKQRRQVESALQMALVKTEALYQVTSSLIAFDNLANLLQTITDNVAEALPADRVLLLTFDFEKRDVTNFVQGGPGVRQIVHLTFEQQMEGLNGWVLSNLKPALALKGAPDPRVAEDVQMRRRDLDIGSVIVVPLQYGDKAVGTLTAINRLDQPDFTDQDVALMVAMSNQAVIAIENARLYEAERQRSLELQTQNEELDSFAHTVAHDLKNPISAIVGYAYLLVKKYHQVLDDEAVGYLSMIEKRSQKMSNIINELLLLSRVRKAEVENRPLDMGSIVGEVLQRLTPMIEEYEGEITLPDQHWPTAVGYASWVEEVWINYVSNAIKYGGRPPCMVLGATEQADGLVRFWVQDNGPGLSVEAQTRLFTPFERLDQVSLEGHGLGLSIVHRIITKLGGKVGVESEAGKGSCFWFALPKVNF